MRFNILTIIAALTLGGAAATALAEQPTKVGGAEMVRKGLIESYVPKKGGIVEAHVNSVVVAEQDTTVHAYSGAYVEARDGSTVYVNRGALVLAFWSATVHAQSGAIVVTNGKATIQKADGSLVLSATRDLVFAPQQGTAGLRKSQQPDIPHFQVAPSGFNSYTAGDTVLALQDSDVLAPGGVAVNAFPGSKVSAQSGSIVKAFPGSKVDAAPGATVKAFPGSHVKSSAGSTIYGCGGEVTGTGTIKPC